MPTSTQRSPAPRMAHAGPSPVGSEGHPPPTIDLRHPHRSLGHRLLGWTGRTGPLRLEEFRHHELLDPDTRANGEFLLHCINESADLNPVGRALMVQYTKETLLNNIQIKHRFTGSGQSRVRDPIIILGMPRTGSTFLFNLLGATDHFRTLRNWETHRPASRAPVPWKRADALLRIRMLHHLAPAMRTIHEQRVEGPEECTKMVLSRFVSQMFPALFHVPAYNDFLATADFLPTYEHYQQQLRILGDQGKRWLLKSPIHTQSLDSILKVFPEARFIHLQRDAPEVLGSICSLTAAFRCLTSNRLDGPEIGREVKKFLTRDNTRAEAILDAHRERVLPLPYRDFLQDPLRTAERIFAFAGNRLTDGMASRIRAEMRVSIPNKYGRHTYRLSDYFPPHAPNLPTAP